MTDPRLVFAILVIALIFGVPCALLIRHARSRIVDEPFSRPEDLGSQ